MHRKDRIDKEVAGWTHGLMEREKAWHRLQIPWTSVLVWWVITMHFTRRCANITDDDVYCVECRQDMFINQPGCEKMAHYKTALHLACETKTFSLPIIKVGPCFNLDCWMQNLIFFLIIAILSIITKAKVHMLGAIGTIQWGCKILWPVLKTTLNIYCYSIYPWSETNNFESVYFALPVVRKLY